MKKFEGIQIRPPTTEKERKDFDKKKRENEENSNEKFTSDVEATGSYLTSLLHNNDSYSEVIPLNTVGEIDSSTFMINAGRTLLERARSVDVSREGLIKLIRGVKEKFKHLKFSLKENKDSLVLKVENKIKKGQSVHWVSQGANQWSTPKRVIHLSEDGQFAFFDGSMTGVPISQLEVVE